MNVRPASDLEINCSVRRVLVRHQVDLGWLSISTCRGAVYIQGDLLLLPGLKSTLTAEGVGAIFDEIDRCPGVSRVSVELHNWCRGGFDDGWKPVAKAVALGPAKGTALGTNTFEITDG